MFPIIPILIAFNKIDISPPAKLEEARRAVPDAYEIIAIEGTGVDKLLEDAVEEVDLQSLQEEIQEHKDSLSQRETGAFDFD